MLGQNATIDELFVKLRSTLEAEVRLQTELSQLMGAMDVLLAGAIPYAAPSQGGGEQRPSKAPRVQQL